MTWSAACRFPRPTWKRPPNISIFLFGDPFGAALSTREFRALNRFEAEGIIGGSAIEIKVFHFKELAVNDCAV